MISYLKISAFSDGFTETHLIFLSLLNSQSIICVFSCSAQTTDQLYSRRRESKLVNYISRRNSSQGWQLLKLSYIYSRQPLKTPVCLKQYNGAAYCIPRTEIRHQAAVIKIHCNGLVLSSYCILLT